MNTVNLNKLKKIHANINHKKGRINSFYVDPRHKKIAALNIKLSNKEIIMDFSVISDIVEKKTIEGSATAIRLDMVEINAMTVLSGDGRVIGKLYDIDMDIQSGDINYLIVKSFIGNGELTFKSDDVLTFGRTIIIVNETPNLKKSVKKNKTKIAKERVLRENSDNDHADELVKRQLKYLIGSKATKDIYMLDGSLIIKEGAIIDEPIIKKAVRAGKTMELLSNE